MKIGIHARNNSFSDRWIKYCIEYKIEYKIVNCYSNDIIDQLRDCDGLMWHWQHHDPKAVLFARQLTYSLEKSGKKVFPNSKSCWHFDDKLGQKYLFESLNIPSIKSYIFYNKQDAYQWIDSINFPKVFKLRNGVSSLNVKLAKNKKEAKRFVRKSFGRGFKNYNKFASIKDKYNIYSRDRNAGNLISVIKAGMRFTIPRENEKFFSNEKGYVYFQDFIEGAEYDLRVIVVGARCWAAARFNRDNDFRASGSGKASFDKKYFPDELIKLAFEISKKLGTQSLAFDFLYQSDKPKLVEISYAYPADKSDYHPGYWDEDLNWHAGSVNAQYFMMEDFIASIENDICY